MISDCVFVLNENRKTIALEKHLLHKRFSKSNFLLPILAPHFLRQQSEGQSGYLNRSTVEQRYLKKHSWKGKSELSGSFDQEEWWIRKDSPEVST